MPSPSTRRSVLAETLADFLLVGVVIVSLVLADAPTWAWVGFGWTVWYSLKGWS